MVLIYDIPYLTHIVLVICSHGIAMGILYNICAYFSNKLDYKTSFKKTRRLSLCWVVLLWNLKNTFHFKLQSFLQSCD